MKKVSLILLPIIFVIGSCTTLNKNSYLDSGLTIEDRVSYLLSVMTLEEKIGQMVQVDYNSLIELDDVKDYYLGSILNGGGSDPDNNLPETWANMYDGVQQEALKTRLGIPVIYGVDAVHGHNNIYGATIFPHNIGLGATGDLDLVEEISRITAIEVAATGIDWTFSPCIAVPRNERWGRTYEGFSENPSVVNQFGKAAIRGYQGENLTDPLTILANAKHYIADGGTLNGKDQGNAQISEEELRSIHLPPYIGALEEGVGSIMASYSSWNGEKLHGHKYLMQDVLRDELGYKGFIVSDWGAIRQLPGEYDDQVKNSINAGVDMIMLPDAYIDFIESMKRLIANGDISMERVDEAVRRVLTVKYQLDLFNKPFTDRSLLPLVGSEEHREVAREAVKKSMVLLKNQDNLLPLNKDINSLLVAGSNAHNLGSQCGGWTIDWHGSRTPDFTIGTTILEAIQQTVSPETETVYSKKGDTEDFGGDVAVLVIGERPYAEFQGDRADLSLDKKDIATFKLLKSKGYKIVTILISGRPMILNDIIEESDAFIAAWLPGTEGLGVTDVLFGDYSPTGKLEHTWPLNMEHIPVNQDNLENKKYLFPYGYGLSYEK